MTRPHQPFENEIGLGRRHAASGVEDWSADGRFFWWFRKGIEIWRVILSSPITSEAAMVMMSA